VHNMYRFSQKLPRAFANFVLLVWTHITYLLTA
jgi:hypothetical protein